MKFKSVLASAACGSLALGALTFACSSNDATPTAADAAPDAPASPQREDAAVDAFVELDAAVACMPQPLVQQPMWHPPRGLNPSACTTQQLQGYLDSCYFSRSPAGCDAFRQENPTCFGCVDSRETDPSWAALSWFDNHTWLRVNFTGCVAVGEGDETDQGCGASWQLVDECERLACRSCSPASTQAQLDDLTACEKKTDATDTCASFIAKADAKCASLGTDSGSAELRRCFVPTGASFDDVVHQYITFWCSTPVTLDAGDDADAN
ncbi:MAG: hypothetical protein JWO86_5039 [Myxococcaceae bacterium]|jgi:hypothetical protein|nr:hypothetical protein [Myxococcaceae bacterium]